MVSECLLQQLLHAYAMVVYCAEADCAGRSNFDLGAVMGQVDWLCEIRRLREMIMAGEVNKYQIGGDHYGKSKLQHWDWVADNNLNYFEGQATKYLVRWKKKDGVKDLEKSLHYMEKLMELYRERRVVPSLRTTAPVHTAEICEQYGCGPIETGIMIALASHISAFELARLQGVLLGFIQQEKARRGSPNTAGH